MTNTAAKSQALRAELASLRAETKRHQVAQQEAAFDGDSATASDLQAKIDTVSSRIAQIEGALQAAARREVKDNRAADQAKVKAARAALVSAGKAAAAQGLVIQKATDTLAVALNDFTAALAGPNFVALRTLRELHAEKEHWAANHITSVNHSLAPVVASTVQAVLANLIFRVGAKEVQASGFVVDVPAVVTQSLERLLRGFDGDAQRLPCYRPEGAAAPVVSDRLPGQACQRALRRSQRDPGCFPAGTGQ